MSGQGPGCVKTCESRERAEIYSQFSPSDTHSQCSCFLKSTKSKRSFYAQFEFGSFHTAWVNRVTLAMCRSLPVQLRTCRCTAITDAMCHSTKGDIVPKHIHHLRTVSSTNKNPDSKAGALAYAHGAIISAANQ